ncbi:hypothetical protein HYH03_016245, partial [Edaphochlamys debaryana]
LVPAPTQRGAQRPRQERDLEECLLELYGMLKLLPGLSPSHAAALAELLSEEPAAAAALIKLHAAALRPSGGDGAGAVDVAWVPPTPLPPSPPALSVLRFVRAMLRAQPFHALGRQLAAAAAAFGAGRSSGGSSGGGMVSAEASLASKILCGSSATVHTVCTLLGLLCCREVAPGLTVEAAAERAACVEEFARGLAESGFLEHSTRLTLMLQARYPQELQKESKLFYIQTLWRAQERASGSAPLMWAPPSPGMTWTPCPLWLLPRVAAALACGLLSSLCTMFNCPSSRNPPALFAACDEARPDGPGFALFLAPLLAYGDTGSCQLALVTLGMMTARGTGTGLFAHMGGSEGDAEQRRSDTGPYRRASEGFFRAASEAMCRCRGLAGADAATAAWGSGGAAAAGPAPSAAAGQPAATGAGNSAAAAGSGAAAEAPPPHLLQFKQMYDFAQAWRQEVSAPGPPAGAGSALATVTAFAAAFRATSAAPIGSNSSSTASAEEVRRGESGRGVGLGLGARPGNAAAKGADATAEGAGSAAATAAGAASVQAGAGRSAASSAGAAASPSAEGSGSAAATASPSASPAAADPAAAAAPPERWGWFRALRWLAAGGLTTAAGMLGGKRGSGQG